MFQDDCVCVICTHSDNVSLSKSWKAIHQVPLYTNCHGQLSVAKTRLHEMVNCFSISEHSMSDDDSNIFSAVNKETHEHQCLATDPTYCYCESPVIFLSKSLCVFFLLAKLHDDSESAGRLSNSDCKGLRTFKNRSSITVSASIKLRIQSRAWWLGRFSIGGPSFHLQLNTVKIGFICRKIPTLKLFESTITYTTLL